MHDASELVKQLQALVLSYTWVIEAWQSSLGGFREDEFGVLDQALQRDSDVDDLSSLLSLAVVCHKLSVPGVQDD